MFRPIPARILKHTVTVIVPLARDAWGNITQHAELMTNTNQRVLDELLRGVMVMVNDEARFTVSRVVMQPTNETRKTKDNTEVDLKALLFVDAKESRPAVDWQALKDAVEAIGGNLSVEFGNRTYTVQSIDILYDDEGILHHYEVGLI